MAAVCIDEGDASVRYLAEVQRKSGFMGGNRADFKLLACERSEQNWGAVSGDELVPAPDDAGHGAGALVLIELSNGRQVQRHYELGGSWLIFCKIFRASIKSLKPKRTRLSSGRSH